MSCDVAFHQGQRNGFSRLIADVYSSAPRTNNDLSTVLRVQKIRETRRCDAAARAEFLMTLARSSWLFGARTPTCLLYTSPSPRD